jgi:hypothetical protein
MPGSTGRRQVFCGFGIRWRGVEISGRAPRSRGGRRDSWRAPPSGREAPNFFAGRRISSRTRAKFLGGAEFFCSAQDFFAGPRILSRGPPILLRGPEFFCAAQNFFGAPRILSRGLRILLLGREFLRRAPNLNSRPANSLGRTGILFRGLRILSRGSEKLGRAFRGNSSRKRVREAVEEIETRTAARIRETAALPPAHSATDEESRGLRKENPSPPEKHSATREKTVQQTKPLCDTRKDSATAVTSLGEPGRLSKPRRSMRGAEGPASTPRAARWPAAARAASRSPHAASPAPGRERSCRRRRRAWDRPRRPAGPRRFP